MSTSTDNPLYFKRCRPAVKRKFYLIYDLIDILDDFQKGETEMDLNELLFRFHSRLRAYVWEAKVMPFILQWVPIDRAHAEHVARQEAKKRRREEQRREREAAIRARGLSF
jgi:hypothetical protein